MQSLSIMVLVFLCLGGLVCGGKDKDKPSRDKGKKPKPPAMPDPSRSIQELEAVPHHVLVTACEVAHLSTEGSHAELAARVHGYYQQLLHSSSAHYHPYSRPNNDGSQPPVTSADSDVINDILASTESLERSMEGRGQQPATITRSTASMGTISTSTPASARPVVSSVSQPVFQFQFPAQRSDSSQSLGMGVSNQGQTNSQGVVSTGSGSMATNCVNSNLAPQLPFRMPDVSSYLPLPPPPAPPTAPTSTPLRPAVSWFGNYFTGFAPQPAPQPAQAPVVPNVVNNPLQGQDMSSLVNTITNAVSNSLASAFAALQGGSQAGQPLVQGGSMSGGFGQQAGVLGQQAGVLGQQAGVLGQQAGAVGLGGQQPF